SAAFSLLLIAAGCVAAASSGGKASEEARDHQDFATIERGQYLALAGDCAACHTAPGGKPYAGGRAIETPFGNVLASNLTPDRETGTGAWSDDDFVSALQHGRSFGGERLYPAMPYPYYTRMTRDDVLAIKAYLDTLEPVHNEVHSNQLPFPLNIRLGMALWNKLFFTAGTFAPAAGKSAEWNRGAYLVEGAGHCGACHTAKNFLGGDKTSRTLAGGALQGWYSPNLTGDPRAGLGQWSADEIATYLKDQPPRGTAAAEGAPDAAVMHAGEAIYVDNCAACHAVAGAGVAGLFPALKGSAAVQSADPTSLVRVVLEGARSVATDAAPTAP